MDVAGKIKPEDKGNLANLIIECQVLENLLKERRAAFQQKVGEVCHYLTDNPKLYVLEMNPGKNTWELKLKPELLSVASLNQLNPNKPLRQN